MLNVLVVNNKQYVLLLNQCFHSYSLIQGKRLCIANSALFYTFVNIFNNFLDKQEQK